MVISKLYEIEDGDELSPSDCTEINCYLSNIDPEDIPVNQRQNVEDYLTTALNLNTVDADLVSCLDRLLEKLQAMK